MSKSRNIALTEIWNQDFLGDDTSFESILWNLTMHL